MARTDQSAPGTADDAPASEPFAAVAETHSAAVFFAGGRAYKLKKPVALGFLDFTSPRARAAACQREIELNRRFAPDVYLGVAEVRDPDGRVCDHLVVMRRMPAARRLSALVQARAPADGAVREVARVLAAWHAAAPRGPQIAAQGSRDALRAPVAGEHRADPGSAGSLLDAAGLDEVERLAGRFTAGRAALFGSGCAAAGWWTATVTCSRTTSSAWTTGSGSWTAWSSMTGCAGSTGWMTRRFLAMDLERLGACDLARRFICWYAEYSGDPAPASLCHHYVAYRAFVRAKVACLRARQGDRQAAAAGVAAGRADAAPPAGRGGHAGPGRRAAGHRQVRAGRGAGGSSRLYRARQRPDPQGTGRRSGGAALRRAMGHRDLHRRLDRAGVRRAARPGGTAARARRIGGRGRVLRLTAPAGRRAAAAAAGAHADLVQLRCAAPAEVTARRLAARTGGVSDADGAVARQMAAVRALAGGRDHRHRPAWPGRRRRHRGTAARGSHSGDPAARAWARVGARPGP